MFASAVLLGNNGVDKTDPYQRTARILLAHRCHRYSHAPCVQKINRILTLFGINAEHFRRRTFL